MDLDVPAALSPLLTESSSSEAPDIMAKLVSAWMRASDSLAEVRNVVAFMIRKGGAGKTSLVLLVADALSRFGLNVLIVDTDPQGNLSSAAGCKVKLLQAGMDRFGRKPLLEPDRLTVVEVIDSGEDGVAADAIQAVPWDEYRDIEAPWHRGGPLNGRFGVIGIIPCYNAIEGLAKNWSLADLKRLSKALCRPEAPGVPAPNVRYDVVLIDTPPGGTDIGRQAAEAANYALLVTNAEKFGIEAIPETMRFLADVRENYDHPDLRTIGLVLNEYQPRRVIVRNQVSGLEAAQSAGNADLDVQLWPERLPNRGIIADSQDEEAPVSAHLAESSGRPAATAVCTVAEGVALRLLDAIGHPLAADIRQQWSTAWPDDQPAELEPTT